MLNFTDEQLMIRDTVREFAKNEIEPKAAEIDQTMEFPAENLRKMGELGFLGIPFSSKYGGGDLDTVSFVLMIEELARVCGATTLSVAAHCSLCATPISMFGNEAQKQKYLPDLLTGKKFGSFCLTEPHSGSDAAALSTTATRQGDHYILNGSKMYVTNGGYAGTYVVFAKTNAQVSKTRGISAFIVEREFPGVIIGKKENKLGLRASDTRQVSFDNCKVPAANLLGEENEGFKYAMQILDGGRIGIGAMAVGLAQAALDKGSAYSMERKAFGKPIADFQAIRWFVADMATEIHAARLMVHHAAQLRDAGKNFVKEAAMAKLFASEMAMRACSKAIQIFGGYGYLMDYPVERYWRDAKLMEIGEGTSEVLRIIISREVLKEL
ncbi:acyl-CoA dehydrogenase [bacterium]|nr:acyl-CoA dehydrogenase [bacterium]